MSGRDDQAVLNDLAGILGRFHGREYPDPITRQTRFFADLGMSSIDAVVLGETLETFYGRKLPFHELLADLGRRQAEDLEVGDLVDFLAPHLSAPPPEG
jgi:acyl carrier protein